MKLTYLKLQNLLANSKVIQQGANGPKVVKLSNNNYLKFFRLKTWFSTAVFYHYANRFIDHSDKLKKLGIQTIDIVNLYIIPKKFIKNSKLTKAVEYTYLPGTTVRDLILSNNISEELIKDLAKFIAKLHNLGIYFKANHLANIIYNDNFKHKFGLIDIDNIKFFGNPLEQGSIIKNFGHMTRYQVDRNWLLANSQLFFDTYLKYSKSSISTSEIKNLVATQV